MARLTHRRGGRCVITGATWLAETGQPCTLLALNAMQGCSGARFWKRRSTSSCRDSCRQVRCTWLFKVAFAKPTAPLPLAKPRPLQSEASPEAVDLEWCESQLFDLTSAWEAADSGQRSRLVAGIFEHLEAEALPEGTLRVVAVPRGAWMPFVERLVLERETGLEPATSTLGRSRSAR